MSSCSCSDLLTREGWEPRSRLASGGGSACCVYLCTGGPRNRGEASEVCKLYKSGKKYEKQGMRELEGSARWHPLWEMALRERALFFVPDVVARARVFVVVRWRCAGVYCFSCPINGVARACAVFRVRTPRLHMLCQRSVTCGAAPTLPS